MPQETIPSVVTTLRLMKRSARGACWLHLEGCNNTDLGKKFGLASSTVRDIVRTIKETDSPVPRKSSGL
ncbi:hypothetical protein BD560DRAFT_450384, partial [Blakeslea trispora]